MWSIQQRLQALLAVRKITLEVDEEAKTWLAEPATSRSTGRCR